MRYETPTPLTPRLMTVLQYLIENRNRVVTKEELISRIWRDSPIQPGTVGRAVSTLRTILSEDIRNPKFIRTVSRVGYWFIHDVTMVEPDVAPACASGVEKFVGRELELSIIREALKRCEEGSGSIVCISGEAGVGKTALLERVITGARVSFLVAKGQCAPNVSGADNYSAFLDIFSELFNTSTPEGSIRSRFAATISEISALKPVVLCIDDIQWADASSVDLISYMSIKIARSRLLFIITFRSADLKRLNHPFRHIQQALQARRVCRELHLPLLSFEETAQYISARFPAGEAADGLASTAYENTEGNPLFILSLLDELLHSGGIVDANHIPAGLENLLTLKMEQLETIDRSLLVIGSLQGTEFDSATLAAVAGKPVEEVDERLHILEQIHELIRHLGQKEIAGGTTSERYAFVHGYYRKTLFRLAKERRD